jgi:hypothetical protein
MAFQIRDQFGQISLASIDPAAVAELSDAAQAKLATLMDAVQAREAAQDRHSKAKLAVVAAETEQAAALQAHKDASDPFPFIPPGIESYGSQAEYNIAFQEARTVHERSVREHRGREAHLAAIAAYTPAQ